ncbi:MAG: OmpA family protein [Pyrinomonadaceae bacterium]
MTNRNLLKIVLILSFLSVSITAARAQVDIPHQTTAITYPEGETIKVNFRGTTRFPRMSGEATVKRSDRRGTEIKLSVEKMPRPFELGAGYATYVVWAISPDGQADNLGEIKRSGLFFIDSKITVTTPLQTFAIIITAEPHFLVRRPSREIMLENVTGYSKSGTPLATVKSVQYFGNSSDYFRDARTPLIAETDYAKTPPTILEARQAVALAKYAGAERDATDELLQAQTLLQDAESAWQAGRDEDQVDISARQAISAAVKAEDTAAARREARERRNEKSRQDAEIQKSENKVADAQQQAEDFKGELASERRARELAERDVANYTEQVKQLRDENAQLREQLGKVRGDAESAKVELARMQGQQQAADAQREKTERVARFQTNAPILMESLKPFGTVRQTERGIVLTLNENYFSGVRVSNFTASGDAKLGSLATLLANTADYKYAVESYIDNKGTPDELQNLTQTRAQAILEKLTAGGIDASRLEAKGYGAGSPVAPNTTNLNRAKNRRVDVILTPTIGQ